MSDNGRPGRGGGRNDNDGGDKKPCAHKVEEGTNRAHDRGDEALVGRQPDCDRFEIIAAI